MNPGLSLADLARAAAAETRGGALPVRVSGVGTDTRSLPRDCLFVALRGKRFDGHRFVEQAAANGASAVVVDREGDAGLTELPVPRLVVADTLVALGEMAASVRQRVAKPVAAVTGSNGKTTTKELLAAALGAAGPVHKTAGNFNNLIGLPLTMLRWPPASWAAVLEMGMSEPGEIARLTQIAAPQVGVVTNVAPAHLLGLGSLAGIARAKAELYAGLGPDSVAVVNAEDPTVAEICVPEITSRITLHFGCSAECDVRVVAAEPLEQGLSLTLAAQDETAGLCLPLHGQHNALNAAAAVACALALGVRLGDAVAGLERVAPIGRRLRVLRDVGPGVGLLDDTYNANPGSMRAAFATLRDLAGVARKVVVLGDMLELGPTSSELHHGVGQAAAEAGAALVLTLGVEGSSTAAGALQGGCAATAFDDMEALLDAVHAELRRGDWVLVKGSRGMRMERVVTAVTGGDN